MHIFELTWPQPLPLPGMPPSHVVALGDFDGMHLGHCEVIGRALRTARSLGLPATVMTFHPHPRAVLGQSKYEQSLTPLADKLELLRGMGVDCVYVVTFDRTFAALSPAQFVEQVLTPLGVNTAVVGFDFTFGHLGAGTADSMTDLAHGRFTVEVVRPYHLHEIKVGSTIIREFVESGQVDRAAELLGRPYNVRGTVVHGHARGRTIGFPTANIAPHDLYVMPAYGVYAVRAQVGGQTYGGVMNIGLRPTFKDGDSSLSLEAHLFDFDQDIYGETIDVSFVRMLRGERKFPAVSELIAQIGRDAEEARRLLAERPPGINIG